MKPSDFHHYRKTEIVQDAFIVLTPAILILVGILWFFRKDWLPMQLTHLITSFLPF
jgi:hypothetical protein